MNVIKTHLQITMIVISTTPFAMADDPLPSDTQRYNEAVQWYAAGETTLAAEAFQQLSGSDRDEIAARSRYNLGNDQYAEALELLEQEGSDPVKAVGLLEDAVKHYRSALKIDSADQDARANIELAMKLISHIQQQQEQKQPQQEPSEHPEKSSENQPSEPQEEPQQQESGSEQSESQQDPGQPENSSEPEKSDRQGDSKAEKSQAQQSKEAGQEGESDPNSEAEPNQDQNQDSAEQNPSQSDTDDGQSGESQSMRPEDSDHQSATAPENSDTQPDADASEAAEQSANAEPSESSTTDGELSAANAQNDSGAADNNDAQKRTAIGVMTEDEANKMLQAIRDRDMLRRLQSQREQRRRQVPVDKDW